MTIDEKASLFFRSILNGGMPISCTSPFFHLICMQIEHPMQMGQAGEEGGFQTCCASSFQSVIHGAHGGVHLNPRVNGNPAAVSQSASRCSPCRTVDDRRSCFQSLH